MLAEIRGTLGTERSVTRLANGPYRQGLSVGCSAGSWNLRPLVSHTRQALRRCRNKNRGRQTWTWSALPVSSSCAHRQIRSAPGEWVLLSLSLRPADRLLFRGNREDERDEQRKGRARVRELR